MPRQINILTLTDARQVVATGNRKAQKLGITYNIKGVNTGLVSIPYVLMDGAATAEFSQRKA